MSNDIEHRSFWTQPHPTIDDFEKLMTQIDRQLILEGKGSCHLEHYNNGTVMVTAGKWNVLMNAQTFDNAMKDAVQQYLKESPEDNKIG